MLPLLRHYIPRLLFAWLDGAINLYQHGPTPLMWIDPWGWERIYEAAPYHHPTKGNAVKSKAPIDGQGALDNSVQIKPSSPRCVGVDIKNNEIVIFDKTKDIPSNKKVKDELYHGHVRDWNELEQEQKNALLKSKKVNKKGKISGCK